jgi:protein-disulfide isomerase
VYGSLPQTTTDLGFPQLGYPNAPVSVVLFTSFDCEACLNLYNQAMPMLTQRARNSEALITFVPLSAGEIPNGDVAARGALCAGEQNRFWDYHDLLYTWAAAYGAEAFTAERLTSGVTELGLDLSAWQTCMLSTFPQRTLEVAINSSQAQASFAGVPSVFVNSVIVPSDATTIEAAILVEVARADAEFRQALEATNTPSPDSTFDPLATEPIVITLPPTQNQAIPPPLTINLPTGWNTVHDTLVLGDVDATRSVPFSAYYGPVTGGTGSIILLWGFPNLVSGNTLAAATIQPDLFTDGLRLLRLAVMQQGCNIGTDLRRAYSIGGLSAVGTQFSAVSCPDELPDTRGWFAGLQQNGINFIFYTYIDPIEAMDAARVELQTILDSVRFTLSSTPTPDS